MITSDSCRLVCYRNSFGETIMDKSTQKEINRTNLTTGEYNELPHWPNKSLEE